MARTSRIEVAGIAQHVIQRGVNHVACFRDDYDRHFFLDSLEAAARKHLCRVHAYVLMSNHIHLLVTGAGVGCVSAMMQSLGRRYVRRFNWRHQRTGTLWQGRFKSSLVDSERYVLTCYRYIEMNPVRARMVGQPHDYAWSSVHANAYGHVDRLVNPHPVFQKLAVDDQTRLMIYRTLLDEAIDGDEIDAIRAHVNQGKALGPPKFQQEIEKLTGRPVTLQPIGRPRKFSNPEKQKVSTFA